MLNKERKFSDYQQTTREDVSELKYRAVMALFEWAKVQRESGFGTREVVQMLEVCAERERHR